LWPPNNKLLVVVDSSQKQSSSSSSSSSEEETLATFEGVTCHVSRESSTEREAWGKKGSLRVTSRRLVFLTTEEGMSFGVAMGLLGLHAVARDPGAVPGPCLYAQLLLDDFPPSSEHPSELYFVPDSPETLPAIFDAVSRAATMNPDDDDEEDAKAEDSLLTPGALLRRFDDMLAFSENDDQQHHTQ